MARMFPPNSNATWRGDRNAAQTVEAARITGGMTARRIRGMPPMIAAATPAAAATPKVSSARPLVGSNERSTRAGSTTSANPNSATAATRLPSVASSPPAAIAELRSTP